MTTAGRRILAEKDQNAPLLLQIKEADTKPNTYLTSRRSSEQHAMSRSPSPVIGTKRKIVEVEDAERVEKPTGNFSQASNRTQFLSDDEPEMPSFSSSAHNQTASYETGATSLPASQNTIESQFELPQDEMSQRTYEKLNAVPLPQNTSQLPPMRPGLVQELSAGSVGLSAYIDFEGPPSTQHSEAMLQPIEIPSGPRKPLDESPKSAQDDAVSRRQLMDAKAAELRTRLQLALYKVQTKQTSQPFSRLKPPKKRMNSPPSTPWTPSLPAPSLSSSTIKAPSSAQTVMDHSHTERSIDSAEAQIAAMRARATEQPKPPVRDLASLPMPQLDPSLMGAGPVHAEPAESSDSNSQATVPFPSSPPLSRQPSTHSDSQLLSGLLAVADANKSVQLSSPPVSEGKQRDDTTVPTTKSVSQGEAASGLVQLMTGRLD